MEEYTEFCGCGNPVRYLTSNGWACNKHFRCLTREELVEAYAKAMHELELYRMFDYYAELCDDVKCQTIQHVIKKYYPNKNKETVNYDDLYKLMCIGF